MRCEQICMGDNTTYLSSIGDQKPLSSEYGIQATQQRLLIFTIHVAKFLKNKETERQHSC